MRPKSWLLTLATSLVLACGDPIEGSGDAGSDSDDTGGSEASTGTAGTTAGPGGSTSPSGSDSDGDTTTTGTETGLSDPSDPATSDPSDPSTTDPTDPSTSDLTDPSTSDPSTSDPSTTGSTTDPTTTGSTTDPTTTGSTTGDMGCVDTHKIPLGVPDADLLNWNEMMSMLGEGQVALYAGGGQDPPPPNHVRWIFDIPCEDTWYIWVRYGNLEQADSYYARLDGMPGPGEAVFDADCDDLGPFGYDWNDLNRRNPGDAQCDYFMDPWSADWLPGAHEFELSFINSGAIARAIVINDPMFVPGPMD